MDLDDVVLVSILQACKATGNLNTCKQIHFAMVSAECDQYPSLAVALISTYGSCSSMVDAEAICVGLYNAEIIAWTACITGYAEAGHSFTCLNFFEQLKLARFRPDGVSFTAILAACCHTGLVIEGFQYFLSMYRDYNITPQSYHYGILVDMFGRVGDFHKIENLLRNTSIQSDISVWLCLLGACRSHSNIELAKKAFDRAIHLQPEHGSAYVFLSNIYADGIPDE
jgi:pentatricopeptide repeat protein